MYGEEEAVDIWVSDVVGAKCWFLPARQSYLIEVVYDNRVLHELIHALYDPREHVDENEIELTFQAAEALLRRF